MSSTILPRVHRSTRSLTLPPARRTRRGGGWSDPACDRGAVAQRMRASSRLYSSRGGVEQTIAVSHPYVRRM
jgi:hypothetical protein